MKKALSVILALAVVISCLSMITVFAEDSVYGKNLLGEAESTFTGQTEVPSVWSKQGNTPTLAIADDPAEAGNKVLRALQRKVGNLRSSMCFNHQKRNGQAQS